MYIPLLNRSADAGEAVKFIQRYHFATLVTAAPRPEATHLPFAVRHENGGVRLLSHVAKANKQWKDFSPEREALVVFQEPHAYVSTLFYDGQMEVPTWNYVAVHCYGAARIITERDEGFALLEAMMDSFEPRYREQWDSLDERFRNELYEGIVPFEITVRELQFKKKLSQNRPPAERERIRLAFEASPDPRIAETGRMMRK